MKRFYCIYSFQCGNNCINCCLEPEFRNNDFKYNLSQIISNLNQYKIEKDDIIEIGGGEPTQDKKTFLEFMNFLVKDKNIDKKRINLLTHAQNFASKSFTEEVSENLGHVTSTFYSPDASMHDYFTQVNGSFDQKITGLNNLLNNGVDLHLKILINKLNYQTLDDYINLCNKHFDQSHIIIGWLCLIGNAWNNREMLTTNLSEVSSYIENAIEKARETSLNLDLAIPLCAIDPYYWNGHLPGYLTKDLEKIVFINPEFECKEKDPKEVPLFSKPSKKCDACLMKEKCVWEWEGYQKYWELDEMLSPIT